MGFLNNTGLANVLGKIKTALSGKVDKTTTVNGHALSGNVSVTKGDVGLGNVNNTSDANKPISTATQTALNGKVSTSTTVNGHALSGNVSVTQQDIGIKYSSEPPSNPSDGDIWLQPESASNILYDTDIASSAITGKSTVNSALTQLNSDVSNLNNQIADSGWQTIAIPQYSTGASIIYRKIGNVVTVIIPNHNYLNMTANVDNVIAVLPIGYRPVSLVVTRNYLLDGYLLVDDNGSIRIHPTTQTQYMSAIFTYIVA